MIHDPQNSSVSLIRKELLILTGNHFAALILNQLVYWTGRVKDFEQFVEEEKQSSSSPQHGWIYKTASDLIEETLMQVDRTTMRRYLHSLIDQGWIFERTNPINKWDRTTQYRLNLRKIQHDLSRLGLSLPGISSLQETDPLSSQESSKEQFAPSKEQNPLSKGQDAHSKVQNAHSYTYTETTPETTNKDLSRKILTEEEKLLEAFKIWKDALHQEVYGTKGRQVRLKAILNQHFQGDLTHWQSFCERVKASPFLMGGGPRRWRASLDWVLIEANLLKILEGNFDSPQVLEAVQEKTARVQKDSQFKEILKTIKDPLWHHWCAQLVAGTKERSSLHITVADLELLSHARVVEVEAKKLLWMGSSSQRALDKIEGLRLPLLSIASQTIPTLRNIRTRLLEGTPQDRLLSPPPAKGDHNAE